MPTQATCSPNTNTPGCHRAVTRAVTVLTQHTNPFFPSQSRWASRGGNAWNPDIEPIGAAGAAGRQAGGQTLLWLGLWCNGWLAVSSRSDARHYLGPACLPVNKPTLSSFHATFELFQIKGIFPYEYFNPTLCQNHRYGMLETEGSGRVLNKLERPPVTLSFRCYFITIVIKCHCQDVWSVLKLVFSLLPLLEGQLLRQALDVLSRIT